MHQGNSPQDILRFALEIATDAAREAGKYLISQQSNVRVLYKKSIRDDLLNVDLQAEVVILEKLRKNFPTFGIISEESARENENAPYQWTVDPLDGSANYQHVSPLFAISIGLLFHKRAVLGIIYVPAFNEMFTAVSGQGAALNGRPIHVSHIRTLNESIVHVGDFTKNGELVENAARLANIGRLANQVGRVRMIGTAATDLAYIACGRADALVLHSNHPWDIEAGRLMITEAGGYDSMLQRGTERSVFIYSNRHIHQQLIDIISMPNAGSGKLL